jgi:hypothetical protein
MNTIYAFKRLAENLVPYVFYQYTGDIEKAKALTSLATKMISDGITPNQLMVIDGVEIQDDRYTIMMESHKENLLELIAGARELDKILENTTVFDVEPPKVESKEGTEWGSATNSGWGAFNA